MSGEFVGIIGIVVLLVLMFLKVRLGTAMILSGFLGYAYLAGWDTALLMIGMEPHVQTAYYPITAIPLFIMMGTVVAVSGISQDLYNAARKWIGHIRGGLAIATVGACGLFAAICGDSIATAVTMGKVAYPEMRRSGYDDRLASACVVAGGTIGILIPPSLGFILYGILTEESVGKLFIAGIIPGILEVFFYIITIYILCRLNPKMAPPIGERVNFREKVAGLKVVWPMIVIFLLVIIGIYAGIFTPTEAGAVGAFGAIVVALILRRFGWNELRKAAAETARSTTMILYVLIGAFVFMRFITLTDLPVAMSQFVVGLQMPKLLILMGIVVVYILLGCFLDVLIVIILTVPIIYPTILGMGYDPIWWGVIMVRVMEIGMITPPFGINLFVLTKAINLPIGIAYQGVAPFVIADFFHVALLIAFPQISLFLVNTL
ncbi:MAG: TRAP transporter large permease [Deltaproteobacteria bacterium]|nr:TRAP transporter large permease [Deltaproteobacteria bacterium]